VAQRQDPLGVHAALGEDALDGSFDASFVHVWSGAEGLVGADVSSPLPLPLHPSILFPFS
jgi:hypothetical protein